MNHRWPIEKINNFVKTLFQSHSSGKMFKADKLNANALSQHGSKSEESCSIQLVFSLSRSIHFHVHEICKSLRYHYNFYSSKMNESNICQLSILKVDSLLLSTFWAKKIHFVIRFIESFKVSLALAYWFRQELTCKCGRFMSARQRRAKIRSNWFFSSEKKCIIRIIILISISFSYLQTFIPLQSFNVERPKDLPLYASSKGHRKHSLDVLDKYSKPYGLPASEQQPSTFPVLKIEEDFDDISMTNGTCKSISTQTSPINEMNSMRINKKVGSSNSLWTSDESILRGAEEDIKSSSSSCEETGGVMSSGKSGKQYSFYGQFCGCTSFVFVFELNKNSEAHSSE